jgi:hypothetical protein
LTGTTPWPTQPPEADLPDPDVTISVQTCHDRHEITYVLTGGTSFPDYLMAIWDIPREFSDCRVETNAKEFIRIVNTDGNRRGIVCFDLEPKSTITVAWYR